VFRKRRRSGRAAGEAGGEAQGAVGVVEEDVADLAGVAVVEGAGKMPNYSCFHFASSLTKGLPT